MNAYEFAFYLMVGVWATVLLLHIQLPKGVGVWGIGIIIAVAYATLAANWS